MLNYIEQMQNQQARRDLTDALRTNNGIGGGMVERRDAPAHQNTTAQSPMTQQQGGQMGTDLGTMFSGSGSGGSAGTTSSGATAGGTSVFGGNSAGSAGTTSASGSGGGGSWFSNLFGGGSGATTAGGTSAGGTAAGGSAAGTSAGGSAAGGSGSGAGAGGALGWAALLAAVIAWNEENSRKHGYRSDNQGHRIRDAFTGRVLSQDTEGKYVPWVEKKMPFTKSTGLSGDMNFGADLGSPASWHELGSDFKSTSIGKGLRKIGNLF